MSGKSDTLGSEYVKGKSSYKRKKSDVLNEEPEDDDEEELEDEEDSPYTVEDAYNEINHKPLG